MGIKGLWSVLAPYSEKKSLYEIRGQTIAVDLAGWVCDSQNVTDYFIQPKLYLRNLFFRTVYLLLADIRPIFVLDGDAPELKRDVMASRNALQFCGAAPRVQNKGGKKNPDVSRKRFRGVLKERQVSCMKHSWRGVLSNGETIVNVKLPKLRSFFGWLATWDIQGDICENLLKCMGVACVKGEGEAEATCAQLNAQGIVNAVVSQDSDCFAYGAFKVYRNFSVSNSAGGGALQGSIDCYDAQKMIESNGFGRNKMVALALLCGCDYGVGACGTSIATVLAFLQTVSDCDVIPRLVSWVSDSEEYEKKTRWMSVPGRCDKCGHAGRTHTRQGCPVCVTNHGCHDTGHKAKLSELKRELALRSRALNCGSPFPEPLVMREFLHRAPDEVNQDDLQPCAPSLIRFVKLMSQKLDWPEKYCVQKFLPLLTKYHFQDRVSNRTLKPINIIKKRVPRGVPSYEVVWCDIDGQYEGLIPDDQFEEGEEPQTAWTTIERQDLMQKYYPDLVTTYEDSKKKPIKEKKSKAVKPSKEGDKPKRKYNKKTAKIAAAISNISNSLKDISLHKSINSSKLNVSVKVNKLKRKRKGAIGNQKTIDSFIKNKKKRLSQKLVNSLRCSFKDLTIQVESDEQFNDFFNNINEEAINIDKSLNNDSEKENINKSMSLFDISHDSINESDLSNIVDNIVKTAPTTKTANVNNNFVKLIFQKNLTPRKSGFRKSILSSLSNKCSTPKGSPKRTSIKYQIDQNNVSVSSKVNTSYFFDKLTDDCDVFETSLNFNFDNHIDLVSDEDRTVNYSVDSKS